LKYKTGLCYTSDKMFSSLLTAA